MPNESDDVVLPTIVVNKDDAAATYESLLVYLFTYQDKYNANDHDAIAFAGEGLNAVSSYLNLMEIWEPEHLGAYPTLETLCQSFEKGPPLLERLGWYAEGAQISLNRWNVEDPDWREPEDDTAEYVEDMLTPEVAIQPQISTGEERVGLEDGPTWTASGWAAEINAAAESEFGVDQHGNVFNKETGEVNDDDPFGVASGPPAWVSQGGWEHNVGVMGAENGDHADQQGAPSATATEDLRTFLVGFHTEPVEPAKGCSKEEWAAYIEELAERLRKLKESKAEFLKVFSVSFDDAGKLWREKKALKGPK